MILSGYLLSLSCPSPPPPLTFMLPVKKNKIRLAPGCVSGALQSVFTSTFRAPAEARTFYALEMPQLPSLGSLTRAPWAHSARGSRPALAGVFKSVWAVVRGIFAGFLVGCAGTWGEQTPPACALPFLRRDASDSTPSAGRAGPEGGGIPGEWGPGRWASSPTRRHLGDTGAPSSRYPAGVDSCAPSGEVPGGRGGPSRRPERLLQVVSRPGRDRAPPLPGARAAEPSGAECPGAAGPSGPPYPRPGCAAALPRAE